MQTTDTVVILVEMVHDARVVRLNGKHLPTACRPWMGDSIGQWEGDTLVVETTNYPARAELPRRLDREPEGDRALHARRPEPDPLPVHGRGPDDVHAALGRRVRVQRRPTDHIYEYACHEGNYALPGILAGAREQEKKAK